MGEASKREDTNRQLFLATASSTEKDRLICNKKQNFGMLKIKHGILLQKHFIQAYFRFPYFNIFLFPFHSFTIFRQACLSIFLYQ